MKFNVKFHQLNNPMVQATLKEVFNSKMPMKLSWNIKKIVEGFEKRSRQATMAYIEVLKKHVEVDEKGNITPDKSPEGEVIPNSYVIKEGSAEALTEEMNEFMKKDYSIHGYKLSVEMLESLSEMTPANIPYLVPILDDDAVEEMRAVSALYSEEEPKE